MVSVVNCITYRQTELCASMTIYWQTETVKNQNSINNLKHSHISAYLWQYKGHFTWPWSNCTLHYVRVSVYFYPVSEYNTQVNQWRQSNMSKQRRHTLTPDTCHQQSYPSTDGAHVYEDIFVNNLHTWAHINRLPGAMQKLIHLLVLLKFSWHRTTRYR